MKPDIVNGLFELGGGIFMWLNVWKLYRDKLVRGVHWVAIAYFAFWGYWNLYYYPFLRQWYSLIGGISVMLANTVYVGMMLYYIRQDKSARRLIRDMVSSPSDIHIGERTFKVEPMIGDRVDGPDI